MVKRKKFREDLTRGIYSTVKGIVETYQSGSAEKSEVSPNRGLPKWRGTDAPEMIRSQGKATHQILPTG